MLEWDEEKRLANIAKHGVDFEDLESFDFDTALVIEDRDSQNEQRWRSIGFLFAQVVVVAFTYRGDAVRVISARRATPAERRRFHG